MKTAKPLIALVSAACLLILFISLRLITLKNQQLKEEAVDNCLRLSGLYEYTDPKKQIHTTAPQKEYYRICLTDKGYSSTWK